MQYRVLSHSKKLISYHSLFYYIMYYVIPYDNVDNKSDYVMNCMQSDKKCNMIMVDVIYKLDDEIKILDVIFPHVLSNIIVEYIRPYILFTLQFFSFLKVYICYNYYFASIQFIKRDNKFILDELNIFQLKFNELCTLRQSMLTYTIDWICQ